MPFIQQQRVRIAANEQVNWLREARERALIEQKTITICPISRGEERVCGDSWDAPQMMFVDENSNREREENEELIRILPSFSSDIHLEWRGAPPVQYIKAMPIFSTRAYNGTFRFCLDGNPEVNRAIVINRQGRIRASKDTNNNQIHELIRSGEVEEPIQCQAES